MLRIFGHHVPVWSLVEVLIDVTVCFAIVLQATSGLPHLWAFAEHSRSHVILPAAAFAGLMAFLYACVGLYRQNGARISLLATCGRALGALAMGALIAYLLRNVGNTEPSTLAVMYAVPMLAVGVVGVRSLAYFARRSAVGVRRVLIVGTGPEARDLAGDLSSDEGIRHAVVVGFYPTGASSQEHQNELGSRVFSASLSVDEIVRTHRVDEIIVAVKEQRGGGVPMAQLLTCRIRGIPVLDLAGSFERAKGEVPIDSLKSSWLVYGLGFVQGGMRSAVKRAFDIVVSLFLLVLASPVMLLTAIAIKLDSRGSVIYRQERVGLHGNTFMCLKFRSMSVDAEKDGVARWATKNDARATRVGTYLRKFRIDELPQLFSVLRGEMSLVGPRPERPAFVRQLQQEIPFYDIRHSVKPGVTGWAQVRYTYGASVEDARKKHQFDLYYVKNHSLFLDLIILLETVSVVLFHEGAH
jgi:sugar transferase (PEP-CTERM system associated)